MNRQWIAIVGAFVISAAACGGSDSNGDGDGGPSGSDADVGVPAPAECVPASAEPEVVKLTTDDGVGLEADLYLAGRANARAAVLLHEIPPANTRANYPRAVIDTLVKAGITVLNVDRRGAGQSGGVAADAYQGPNGRLDAKAAHDFLRAHACPVNADGIGYVGASNGTTTVVDFAFLAQTKAAIARAKALVLISAGAYTDAQTKIEEQRLLYERIPMLFVYGGTDPQSMAWNDAFAKAKAPAWEIEKLEGDAAHGTQLFANHPNLGDRIAAFIAQAQ